MLLTPLLCSYDLNCSGAGVRVRYAKRDPHAASVAELWTFTYFCRVILSIWSHYALDGHNVKVESGPELEQWQLIWINGQGHRKLRGSLTIKFNIFIIQFREKCSKQNIKKTFWENVFVCEDFSLNQKENKLHRKYNIFVGSTENRSPPPILEIEQNG